MNLDKTMHIGIVPVFIAVLLGILIGVLWKPIRITEHETVYLDERLKECVKQGGEYSVRRKYASQSYYANCEIPEKKEFEIEIPIEK